MRPVIILFISFFALSTGVDPNNFKTCEQSSFCRRGRKVQGSGSSTKYALLSDTLSTYSDSLTVDLLNKDNNHSFELKLEALAGNIFRIQIDEKNSFRPRYKVEHALKNKPESGKIKVQKENNELIVKANGTKAVIFSDPFRIDFYEGDVLSVSVNAKNWLYFEHLRHKESKNDELSEEKKNADEEIPEHPNDHKQKQQEQYSAEGTSTDEHGTWEENFKSHHDSKPYGPEAVALDFSFPAAEVLFGIPEHADSFILKSTVGTDPYRLYNLDVFEYTVDSKMALYGSVPVLYGHGNERTAGVFWHNAAETWVDVITAEKNVVSSIVNFVSGSHKSNPVAAHFISESGIIDAFILLGPSPLEAFQQYTKLTGTASLPQMFTLGYHQSRWNYIDERDVTTVSAKFDQYNLPMDTMWLDIEYTDGKKYFTWDQYKFPEPLTMIKNLSDVGRHLVIIIDPHIKRDTSYFFHNICTERGYYVKTRDGKDYEGWCWPGSASYPDFFNPEVRDYYSDQYLLSNFKTVTSDVMIWNDMNEPSVFNGPEVTAPKDLVHFGNLEHRDIHNIYGHMQLIGTFNGLLNRDENQRPFILTRAHFAGSQRYAAIWTGDNMAEWPHLQHSIKMCLSEAVAGFSFCGADVGGFFGNPDVELLERWYQAAAFLPFFRGHAHIDTKRREPWLFPEKTRLIIAEALYKRYSYLPLWYTAFYEHERDGMPVIRPLLAHYPQDKNAFNIDHALLVQDRLLVQPVLHQGATKIDVYFPALDLKYTSHLWYDVDTYKSFGKAGYETIAVDEHKIPVFQRGGTIIPKKERLRRSSLLMKNDPYTLVVCLDSEGKAQGTLYLDDEKTYEYRKGKYIYVNYKFESNQLTNHFVEEPNFDSSEWLERIVIAGLNNAPKTAIITVQGITKQLDIIGHENFYIVRRPGIPMNAEFEIRLNY